MVGISYHERNRRRNSVSRQPELLQSAGNAVILARFILEFDYDSRIIAWSNHKTVILSLFWRRISRDVSVSITLAPECRFLGQNAAQLQMRSMHSGRSFAQRRGSG